VVATTLIYKEKWAVFSAHSNHYQIYFQVNPLSYKLKWLINHNWISNLEYNLEEVYSHVTLDSIDP